MPGVEEKFCFLPPECHPMAGKQTQGWNFVAWMPFYFFLPPGMVFTSLTRTSETRHRARSAGRDPENRDMQGRQGGRPLPMAKADVFFVRSLGPPG